MPFDGSGNFTRSYNFVNDKNLGIKIVASRMDGEFDNYAAALNQTMLRTGVVPMSGSLNMGGNSIHTLGDGTVGTPAIRFSSDPTTGIFIPAYGKIALSAGGVSRLEANSTGVSVNGNFAATKVMAGTSGLGLSNSFEVGNASYGALASLRTLTAGGVNPYFQITSSASGITLEENGSVYGALMFSTSAIERMRLEAGGNLALGSTASAGYRLNVDSGASNEIARFKGAANGYASLTDGTGEFRMQMSSNSPFLTSIGAYPVILGTNNTERMRILSTGEVGIGTAAPGGPLHVSANSTRPIVQSTGNGQYATWRYQAKNSGGGAVLFEQGAGITADNAFETYDNQNAHLVNRYISGASGYWAWHTNGTERARIDASGNLIVGGSTALLTGAGRGNVTINGSSNAILTLGIGSVAQSWLYANGSSTFVSSANALSFETGGSNTRAIIDASGNFGVGTVSPQKKFAVSDAGNFGIELSPNDAAAGYNRFMNCNRTGAVYVPVRYEASTHAWYAGTAGTTRSMEIDSAGNVGIGTNGLGAKFEVAGVTRFSNATQTNSAILAFTPDATGSNGVTVEASYFGAGGYGPIKVLTGGAERLRVASAGQIGLSGANYGTSGQTIVSQGAGSAPVWGSPSAVATGATIDGVTIGYRNIPVSGTSGTAAVGDVGKCIPITGNITIPSATFAAGDVLMLYNDSAAALSVLQGAGLTLRQAGTANTGNRSLAARGWATVWFRSASEAIINGAA